MTIWFRLFVCVGVLCLAACTTIPDQQGFDEPYFTRLAGEPVVSDPSVTWHPVGPGLSGYNEELWLHPSDPETVLIGPDMHVTYGSWDGGRTWHGVENPDGLGEEMKRVIDIEFSRQNPDLGLAIDWNGWLYRTTDRGRNWEKTAELTRSVSDLGYDPYAPLAFREGWYDEQLGTRLSELAVDPTDDRVWYLGAGNFWDVKVAHRSLANPKGPMFDYVDYGYVLKSVDGGRSWSKISEGLPEDLSVGRIIVDPRNSNRLAMVATSGLMLSDDGGLSWDQEFSGLPNNLPRDMTMHYDAQSGATRLILVEQTFFEPDGPSIRSRGGVFISDDFGRSWRSITGDLAIDLSRISYPAEINRFFRAVGQWLGREPAEVRRTYPDLPKAALPVFNRVVVSPANRDEIYLTYNKKHDRTFGPGEVWRTLDGGVTWQVVARHGSYWEAGKDADYWRERGNPTEPNVGFAHLAEELSRADEVSGNRLLEIGVDGAIYISVDQQTQRSRDRGETWEQIDDVALTPGVWLGRGNSDLPGRQMLLETGVPGRRLLASGEHGIWQTVPGHTPDGSTNIAVEQIEGQVHHDGMVSIASMAVHPHDPQTIFALSWRQSHAGKLRVTRDGGAHWENIATVIELSKDPAEAQQAIDFGKGPPNLLPPQNSLTIDPVNPLNMYLVVTRLPFTEIYRAPRRPPAIGGYGFMRSSDGGLKWEVSNAGLPEDVNLRRLAMHPDDPAVLYAAASGSHGALYRSNDRGSSWQRVAIPSEITSVNNVFIDPNTRAIYIAAGDPYTGSAEGGGAWRSDDGGSTWRRIFAAPLVTQIESSPLDPEFLLLTVYRELRNPATFVNPGLFLSRDGGESWSKINRGLDSHEKIIDARPDPADVNRLWAAGWGSGWSVGVIAED